MGSWKIMDISLPRMDCISLVVRSRTSLPPNLMEPEILVRRSLCRRMTESEVTDLPQPDSPTKPTISPALTLKDTPFTAVIQSFLPRLNCVLRSLTSKRVSDIRASLVQSRVERVAQTVTEQVEGKHGQENHQAGEKDQVRSNSQVVAALRQNRAPLGLRHGCAEAQEGQG